MNGHEIAIVGMSGRFPGAEDIDQLWNNLVESKESIRFFTDDELLEAGIEKSVLENPNYVKANGILDHIEEFDADFFGMNPREVYLLDVQHRVFLECAWQALESAAIDPHREQNPVGVFASCGFPTRSIDLFSQAKAKQNMSELYQILIQNDKDFLATLTSYKLGLRGPSFTIQTACSSSAVAIYLACQSLLTGDCDIALAGGSKIYLPQICGYLHVPGMILSPDGHCRPFDARAQGMVTTNGCGIVVLKRLADAVADGDFILAVILGSAINNDGNDKDGISAPSVKGQQDVILKALSKAKVDPRTLSYVEAHGTGTLLGDPVEVQALTQAYRKYTPETQYCGLGSVKSNLGHLDAAAGITGLIKATLALHHRALPATVNFTRANEKLKLQDSPFYVVDSLTSWDQPEPLRAGVSSFGVGGTNVHMILEQAPERAQKAETGREHILVLSAKSANSLMRTRDKLALFLREHGDLSVQDIAHSLQTGRQEFSHRFACVVKTIPSAITTLQSASTGQQKSSNAQRPVAFLFPGQGAQYVNMGRSLYEDFCVFRNAFDECSAIYRDVSDVNLIPKLFPESPPEGDSGSQLLQTELAQPAIFMIEYSLAKLWMSAGIRPDVMIGHSVGEITSACLAGVISLEHALYMITQRGRLLQSLPPGAMLAINRPVNEIEPLLPENIDIAAINTPDSMVVSGPVSQIETLKSKLAAQRIASIRLQTSHAFHSHMMEPILPEFKHYMANVHVNPEPQIPYFSSLTGARITLNELKDRDYWAKHIRQTVRFSRALEYLWKEMNPILIEVGPGRVLSAFAKSHSQRPDFCTTLSSLPHSKEKSSASHHFLKSVGRLWELGQVIDWLAIRPQANRVMLPGIVFDKQRFEMQVSGFAFGTSVQKSIGPYYRPVWRGGFRLKEHSGRANTIKQIVLFSNDDQFSVQDQFDDQDNTLYRIRPGHQFSHIDNDIHIRPGHTADYQKVLDLIDPTQPLLVVHAWLFDKHPETAGASDIERFHNAAQTGFLSLVYLLQSAIALEKTTIDILVLTNGLYDVLGNETLTVEKNSVIGALLSINQEYPNVNGYLVDTDEEAIPVESAINEMQTRSQFIAALRHRRLWFRDYEPVMRPATPYSLESGKTILITGGTGRIGLWFAKAMAEKADVHLILVGRTLYPPQTQWVNYIEDERTESGMRNKVKQLLEIQKTECRLTVIQADISQKSDVQQLKKTLDTMGCSLNGIIHCAGLVRHEYFRTLANMDAEILNSHFRAKVFGLVNLVEVFDDAQLDFCLLASSLSAILGGLGFAAYAGSNAILDAMAWQQNRRNSSWISVNWDAWQSGAMDDGITDIGSDANQSPITPEQGQQALFEILSNDSEPQIAMSTSNLDHRLQQWVQKIKTPDQTVNNTTRGHQRPELSSDYVAPTDPVQIHLTEIFQDCFGFENIGIYDNFFELGGDSLLATQIAARIQSTLGVHVDLELLFKDPTIAHLAETLSEKMIQDMDPAELSDLIDEIDPEQKEDHE
ncbi:acyltransferase domain-containing protein [candidate division KSB1 bacterium]|nr:acyltransferase domain-containing protein [candidate division KSB1 bacterium]